MNKLRLLLLVGLCFVAAAASAADPAAPVTLEGTVEVLVADDFEHGSSRTLHFLRERRSNERLELQLSPDQAKRIRPGQELRVRGARRGKVLAADPGADAVTVLTEQASLVPPDAARRVINIIIDITDGAGATHAVHGECNGHEQILADAMFGTRGSPNVDGCFRDSSNDLMGFGGQSYPGTAMDVVRVVIVEPSSSLANICSYDAWAAQADAEAIAQGVDLSSYQHRMYLLPMTTSGCWWAGLAYVGCGESCKAWVRAFTDHQHSTGPCGLHDTLAHELGHNVGMMHASTDPNNDGISDCEYCDTTDIMGYSLGTWRGFNAPRRDQMGWLGAEQIADGASGGVFTISALGMRNSPHPQVVKIVPSSGLPYWLSYRAPIGYDARIFETFHFNKLQVHRAHEGGYTYLITQLPDGATHVDATLGLTVTQLGHTADSATLEVRYGAAFSLSSSSLAFGNGALNLASSAKAITLRNTGAAALPITSIAIGGPSAGQFSQTHNCGTSVAAGASCTIRVTFKPTSTGSKTAALTVTAGAAANTKRVSLSGTGVRAAYTLSASSQAFGNQALNLVSSAKTVTLRNTGVTGLPIQSIVLGGTHPGHFAQTNNCGTSVAVGASCAIRVTFKPTSTGSKGAGLHVTAGGGAGIKSVSLSGTGVRSTFSVSPTALSFGNVVRNTSSTAKAVRVSNTGIVVLPISSIDLAGTNPGQFARTHNCPARVPVGGSCMASVVFKPTSTGAKSALLQVKPGGGAALKSVSLNGTGN